MADTDPIPRLPRLRIAARRATRALYQHARECPDCSVAHEHPSLYIGIGCAIGERLAHASAEAGLALSRAWAAHQEHSQERVPQWALTEDQEAVLGALQAHIMMKRPGSTATEITEAVRRLPVYPTGSLAPLDAGLPGLVEDALLDLLECGLGRVEDSAVFFDDMRWHFTPPESEPEPEGAV